MSGSESAGGRPRWLGFVQLVLIVAAVAVALWFARAPERVQRGVVSDLTDEKARPAVSVVRPAPVAQSLTVELTGSVRMERRIRIASEVVGRVVFVSPDFANGGSIAANETFIRVDPAGYELEVEAAERAVREAEARVEMERARGEEGAKSFELAEASTMKARTALAQARLQLRRTSISLPHDVRVVRSDVAVGELVGPAELVGPSSRLGVVFRSGALEVDAPISTRDLEYLAPAVGRPAEIRAGGRTWPAEIVRVSSVVSPKTRLASIFLRFGEGSPPESLPRPGTFVEVAITGPTHDNVYVLPEAAVQERGRVWVVDGGELRSFVPQQIGRTAEGWVVEAFDAGEGVVVGALPGARAGLAVVATDAGSSE
jgi:multidrug efflux pump subunit AcrA (membrane-fusion protein)